MATGRLVSPKGLLGRRLGFADHTTGFPGFWSKLWISDPATGTYRGLYAWDGAERAVDYADHLVRLLTPCRPVARSATTSLPGSVGGTSSVTRARRR